VEAGDFGAHLEAGRGVEIGEGLIEQEDLWSADDGAAESDTLALAAGERGGLAVKTGSKVEGLRGILHALSNFRPGTCRSFNRRQVVIDGHVGVEA